MSFFAVIKKNAKAALAGRWRAAAGVFAFVAGTSVLLAVLEQGALRIFVAPPFPYYWGDILDYAYFLRLMFTYAAGELVVMAVAAALSLLIFAPLLLGVTRWLYLLVQGERPIFLDIFRFFESARRYGKAIWYGVNLGVRALGWAVAFLLLPGGLIEICVQLLRIDTIGREVRAAASVGILLAAALMLLMILLYAIFINRYALTAYLLCEDDETSVRQAFRDSIRFTKGYRGIKFLFTLSYTGWYLLSVVTFGLALLFVVPYHMAGETVFARYLVEKGRGSHGNQIQ